MPYNTENLTKLSQLKLLAQKTKQEIDAIVSAGGEPNVLEGVKVNGTETSVVTIATDTEVTEMLNEVFAEEQA